MCAMASGTVLKTRFTGFMFGCGRCCTVSRNITSIYIRPEYRGTGIGSELIRLFKEYCRDNDCGEINVTFADGNTRGEEFYRTQGFEELTRTFKLEVK